MRRLLLCTDLDRTAIPNGAQPESPRAKDLFQRLAQRDEITLVYVTGRHLRLIEQAILQWDLPIPDLAIGDVGTSIYEASATGWTLWEDWQDHLCQSWSQAGVQRLKERLQALPQMWLQEPEKQNRFKVSFYLGLDASDNQLHAQVEELAQICDVDVKLVWSIDRENQVGLLDILPPHASKLSAMVYLMQRHGFLTQDTLFAGDSGNDFDVFRSHIPCVIVANADSDIKLWAAAQRRDQLYVASGQSGQLNGNYRAGIVEGACHFWPEVAEWLT